MKVYKMKKELFVKRELREVFAFFEQPENLERLTPSTLGFKILTPSPIKMKEGALIDYTIRLGGVPVHWQTLISDYDPPYRFVDEQLKGPYTFWHHTHTFTEKDGGTLIADEVRYVLPFGILGRFVHSLFVKRQLMHIFDFRSSVIKEILENESENKNIDTSESSGAGD